jgi:hypothetical protein
MGYSHIGFEKKSIRVMCSLFFSSSQLNKCSIIYLFFPLLLGYIHCIEGIHCTLVRSPSPPPPLHNPLSAPIKAIERGFIVLFHICI